MKQLLVPGDLVRPRRPRVHPWSVPIGSSIGLIVVPNCVRGLLVAVIRIEWSPGKFYDEAMVFDSDSHRYGWCSVSDLTKLTFRNRKAPQCLIKR